MQVPDKVFPSFVKRIVAVLPTKPPGWLLVKALNQLLNRQILNADMSLLAGRYFNIVIKDLGVSVYFTANQQQFLLTSANADVDLCFTANTTDYMKMLLRKEDPDTLFFNRKLQIEGDTELGLVVKNLLDSIDWSTIPIMKSMIG